MAPDRRRRKSAIFRARNYRALAHTMTTYEKPIDALDRYVRGVGDYPWRPRLRTPIGPIELLVPHPHDVRTVNEVFCRRDYGSGAPGVIVDIGGNIGVSAAFWLSRSTTSRVHVWEPVPHNLGTLHGNIAPFADRCVVHEAALSPRAGPATFFIDPIGRYSGLAAYQEATGDTVAVEVDCEAVGDALRGVLEVEGRIDLLKIDTEGSEDAIVAAIPADLRCAIGAIVHEYPGGVRWLHS